MIRDQKWVLTNTDSCLKQHLSKRQMLLWHFCRNNDTNHVICRYRLSLRFDPVQKLRTLEGKSNIYQKRCLMWHNNVVQCWLYGFGKPNMLLTLLFKNQLNRNQQPAWFKARTLLMEILWELQTSYLCLLVISVAIIELKVVLFNCAETVFNFLYHWWIF